jgi:hypothetical protein
MIGYVHAGTEENNEKPDENPTHWTTGHTIGLNLSQVGLKNWSAGGDPSISFIFTGGYDAKMTKNRHVWQNKLNGEWGMLRIKGEEFRKNSDVFMVESKYGFQIDKVVQDEEGKDLPGKWYLSFTAGLKSQFSKTYTFDDNGEKDMTISRFGAPMTVGYSLGIDYKPNPYFSLFMSPLAAKHIIVTDDDIAAMNLHGNDGMNVKNFFGAALIASYDQQVYPKPENRIAAEDGGDANAVFLSSRLSLFRDYLSGPAENLDVDWQTSINIKVARYISASVFMHLIWDWDVDTDPVADGIQRNVQFKDVIGVGVAYTISDKKPNLNR